MCIINALSTRIELHGEYAIWSGAAPAVLYAPTHIYISVKYISYRYTLFTTIMFRVCVLRERPSENTNGFL